MTKIFNSGMLLAAMAIILGAAGIAEAQSNSANVAFTRTVAGDYVAGGTLTVTINMTSDPDATLLALALRETLPNGWTFGAVTSTDSPPNITPDAGDGGELEFAWINTPSFPYTMVYTVTVGDDVFESVNMTGQIEYREIGVAQFSSVVQTTVESDMVDMMEDACGCSASTASNGSTGDVAVVIGAAMLLAGIAFARSRREQSEFVRTRERG